MASGSAAMTPVSRADDGVRVVLRVSPRAARDRIQCVAADGEGGAVLKISGTAVPEDGKADGAVIRLPAKAWRVPRQILRITRGASGRRKKLHVAGPPDELAARIAEHMAHKGGTIG